MKPRLIFKILAILLSSPMIHQAQAANLDLLRNDKEITIRAFSGKEDQRIRALYKDETKNNQIKKIFYGSVQTYLESENLKCELALSSSFEQGLRVSGLPHTEGDIVSHLKMLRSTNAIDDILYEMVVDITSDQFALRTFANQKLLKGNSKIDQGLLKENDLTSHYAPFAQWPDEQSHCVYQDYIHLKNIIFTEDGVLSKDTGDFKYLNSHALSKNLISSETFRKLEYLRTESSINDRSFWLQDYFKIIFSAKNKMTAIKKSSVKEKIEDEWNNDFSSKRLKRFSQLTRRRLLYEKYDETQIIQLAQVLQKASRRMGTDADTATKAPVISQEFSVLLQNGERETYVEKDELDPQSQYNYARRLLRKDMLTLQMMDSFKKIKVTYEDVIMASLETGYITFEDINFVASYDDLWNPHKSKFQKITGFIFSVAGYSTFFLAPPWNIVAAVALGVTEGAVDNKFKTGADHDNPATFIE